ncbi:MAG: C25 family cysteine peptidase, partial [Ignavibacteriae bacterium]|nr:C25 family cysteine peptidase [Ignavibacteriota bacterium]
MKTFNVLKVMVIFGLLCFMFALNTQAQDIRTYNNSWGPTGMTLTRQNFSGVEVNFSVNKLYIEDVNVDGIVLKAAKMEGIFLPNDAGMPDLAGTGRMIAIPQGANATFRIVSYKTEVIKDIDIAPAPVLPKDNDPSPLKYLRNYSVYGKNANYPANPVTLSDKMKFRGVDVVMLGITPFQYNPVTKELTVYTDIKVEVNFAGGNGHFGDDAYRNRWWEPMFCDHLLNYSSLPKIDFDHRYTDIMDRDGYEYVIIVPNNPEFSQWADTIKNFRTAQGIKTGIYKLSDIGGNTVAAIKTWVTNAYTNWSIKPVAICLLADYSTNSSGASGIISTLQPDPGYPDFASDNYYSDVNNDEMPEIVFSRIIANNSTELQTLISKNLSYERNPPTTPSFYANPITALGWQTERWFQVCSEVLGGFFKKSLGKFPVRINKVYSGTPGNVWSTATNTATVISYFGPQGRYYIPQTPDSLGGFDGGTPTQVVNAINAGSFLLQHRDHGMYTGWGEPGFTTSYIPQLTNVGTNLTFIYSINCETGAYHNPSGCPAEASFVEVFYRYKYNNQNSGALGMVCPSEVSYSFVNDTYCWGMYDNMWPNFMPDYGGNAIPSRDLKPAFGMASGKYFLQSSSWPYNTGDKQVTYRLFHMHGDAFLNLYSEVPQNLTVNHSSAIISGATQFAVTANAGSFIALSINGNILGTATGTGSPVNITIPGTQVPPQVMSVVITKQNYYRYQGFVNVVPASGPYVVQDSVAINDPTPNGNNNHLMDYGEANQLTFRAKNVGSVVANNVNIKVRTTNPYITMTDSTESFGNIAAGSTVLVNNAFAYNVSNYIPDNTSVSFEVIATSGTDIWTSSFSLIGHASLVKMGSNIITDSTGNNNGRIDPGESAKFKIALRNQGTSQARNVSAKLTTTSTYITLTQDSVIFGNINAADSLRGTFQLSASPTTPIGTLAKFKLKMYTLNGLISTIDSFAVTIGQNWS